MPTEGEKVEVDPALRDEKLYKKWMGEIQDALKREKKFREAGKKCVDLYEAKKADETPFAILYSNTEVLAPAVYNARPIPIVKRRYQDADPVGKAVSEVSTRVLKFLIDTDNQNYDSFDELMHPAVLDGLVTNRGLTRFKHFVTEEKECVFGEAVRWDKFFHGYARTWKKVPWIGFEHDMTQEEIRESFPDRVLDFGKSYSSSEDMPDNAEDREEMTGVQLFKVFELWDKLEGKVLFISPVCSKGPLREVDDPLGLSSFFPIPKPLNFMRKITTLVPTPLYEQYRSQAQELNEVTRRLKAIIRAIRYRGAYNNTIDGIEKMLEADDNVLVPVDNIASMPDSAQGIDKLLYIIPVNELVQTAQSLVQAREQIKQVIYEITGISDILRGASVASETATAQNIKNQWGSLRLKRMQKEVQRYCRDALAITLEIASKFEISTLKQMTGLPYLGMEQKQQLQMQVQQFQMQAQQAQQMGQQPPQPPVDPAVVQKLLAQPTWEEIAQVLKNHVTLHYKVDIETNSTIDAEAAQDKQDIAELLNALSQFLTGIGPLVQEGVLPMNIAKDMLLVITRRYNFGSQLEESIMQMGTAPPKTDEGDQQAAEVARVTAQAKLQEIQMKMKSDAAKHQMEMEKMQFEEQMMREEAAIKREELGMQRLAVEHKGRMMAQQHEQKMQIMKEKGAQDRAKGTSDAT